MLRALFSSSLTSLRSPLRVRFYTRQDCPLCDSAWSVLKRVQNKIGEKKVTVERVDIDQFPSYSSNYGNVIPVITVLPKNEPGEEVEIARSFVEEKALYAALHALEKK